MKSIDGINCITNRPERLEIENGRIKKVILLDPVEKPNCFLGPGLIDVQINGIDGIDFNDTNLQTEDVHYVTRYLLSKGITTYFPTLITNSDANIHYLIKVIKDACAHFPLVNACVGGIHLEGPFISEVDGARGAHNQQFIKAPDWQWVEKCQQLSGGKVKLITLSPEWKASIQLVQKCRNEGILVGIGHSNANPEQIREAVEAGASLSTHLGNAVPLMLPRHPNLLWEQLAIDDLFASIIADGFHLPDAFLKVVIRAKGKKAFLVSDATCFSGRPPGKYQTHIGDEVVLDQAGRLSMKSSPDLLAGATKSLLEDLQYLVDEKLVSINDAWKMASIYPSSFLGYKNYGLNVSQPADLVAFQLDPHDKVLIKKVVKNGVCVYEA